MTPPKVAIVFFAPSSKPNPLLDAMQQALESKYAVSLFRLKPQSSAKKKRFFGLGRTPKNTNGKPAEVDVSGFDVILVGSTIEGMMPKRKLPAEIESFLRHGRGIEKKPVAGFVSAFGVAGTTPQKMASLLHTRDAQVQSVKVFSYLLSFSAQQLKQAAEFALASVESLCPPAVQPVLPSQLP